MSYFDELGSDSAILWPMQAPRQLGSPRVEGRHDDQYSELMHLVSYRIVQIPALCARKFLSPVSSFWGPFQSSPHDSIRTRITPLSLCLAVQSNVKARIKEGDGQDQTKSKRDLDENGDKKSDSVNSRVTDDNCEIRTRARRYEP